jgi:hypothetical protein
MATYGVWLAISVVIVILILWWTRGTSEHLNNELGFAAVSSGDPVPYGKLRTCPSGAICLGRWRQPIPVGASARQVSDDTWARTYDSGQGFTMY